MAPQYGIYLRTILNYQKDPFVDPLWPLGNPNIGGAYDPYEAVYVLSILSFRLFIFHWILYYCGNIPKTSILSPQPSTLDPKPSTLNPKPQTLNLKPQTPNPKPKPETPNPKPLIKDLTLSFCSSCSTFSLLPRPASTSRQLAAYMGHSLKLLDAPHSNTCNTAQDNPLHNSLHGVWTYSSHVVVLCLKVV